MNTKIKKKPIFHDILNSAKQVKQFLKRRYKFIKTVRQFDEEHPPHEIEILRFFKYLKNSKILRHCWLRWPILFQAPVPPDILRNIYKHHSRFIQFSDIFISHMIFHITLNNLITPLRAIKEAYIYAKKKELLKIRT